MALAHTVGAAHTIAVARGAVLRSTWAHLCLTRFALIQALANAAGSAVGVNALAMTRAATLASRDAAVIALPVGRASARAVIALTVRSLAVSRHSVAAASKARTLLGAASWLGPPLSTVTHTILLACAMARATARTRQGRAVSAGM